MSSVTYRCEICDGDLTDFYKQGLTKRVECIHCHRRVDLKKRMYRTREVEVDGQSFTVKIYRRKMQVGRGHHLEGTAEYMGRLMVQDTYSDDNEEKLLSLVKNTIRMRMQSKGPI